MNYITRQISRFVHIIKCANIQLNFYYLTNPACINTIKNNSFTKFCDKNKF